MNVEQRTNIKFLAKLGKSPTETLNLLKTVYGEQVMSRTQVFEWHKRFSTGREDVGDDPKSGRLSTSRTEANIERVKELIRSEANEQLGLDKESVRSILVDDLGMRKICAKMVPRLLTDDQKTRRVNTCHDVLDQLEVNTKLVENVINGDESWVF